MDDGSYKLGSYQLANDGTFAFTKYKRLKTGNISEAFLIEKIPGSNYNIHELGNSTGVNTLFLDDIKVRVDEANQRYILASLYSNTAKGDMDGIYVSAFNKGSGQHIFEKTARFDDDLRKRAKLSGGALKSVFNDYFINNIILDGNGSFAIASEALYTSGGNTWDRWGYWGSPWYGSLSGWGAGWGYWSPYRFYTPFFYRSYWWGNPGLGGGGGSRYHAGNIAIVSFDRDGNKQWDNVIIKHQDDTETDGSISYQVVNTGDNMHFLLNNSGKISTLENIIVGSAGDMQAPPAVKAKDKNIDFMPRYGKQVSAHELIIPYRYKGNISFAKITM